MANNTAFTSGRDLNSVSENVELLTGQRGNQLDKAVTYRDLESLGVATLSRIGSNYKATANPALIAKSSAVDFPAKPLNVAANGAFNTILIDWDEPNYRGHSYAEVWRAEVDNLSVAVKIGTSSANMYSDPIGGSAKVYYWVRFVNRNDDEGPYNASAGTYAETAENIQNILDALQGQIEASHLAQALLDDIAQIPIINSSVQAGATQIQQITVDLSSLNTRQSQAEAILKAAQDLLGSTTINVSLLHDELNQKVLQYGADVQSLRNAILSVDPATGEITIDAINVVRAELQTNIDQVTQRVSSVEGTLTQKASSVEVSLQAQRISTVETQMSSINAELTNQVTRAEFTETTEEVTQLTTRMSAAEGTITQKATQQSVDQLGARVSTAESGLVAVNADLESKATQISQIDSSYKAADAANSEAIAENAAAITELSQSVSTSNSAISTHLTNLDSSVSGLSSSVTQLQQTSTGSSESVASIYDQLKAKTDISAIAAASAALSDDESTRQGRYSEAFIKHEINVLTNNQESLAQSVEVFKADFETETAAISAQIANEQTARTTAVESLAQVVSTIDATYKSADVAVNARIVTEESARATADSALSQQINTVQATANNLTASVQTQSSAISTLQSGAQAMWTAKTQVGQITTGIGIMTDSAGKSQVMISASQLFVFDPNSAAPTQSLFAVSGGKVIIQKAIIEAATIETVTAMSITADYVRAGVSITSPSISGGTLSLGSGDNSIFMAGGALGLGKGGPYGGWGYGWHTIIYNDGGIYTDRLHASSGDFTGYVRATSGYMTNVTIGEDCNVLGTIYANKIVGDVVAIKPVNFSFPSYKLNEGATVNLFSFSISASNKARYIKISGSSCSNTGNGVYMRILIGGLLVESSMSSVDGLHLVPANPSGPTQILFQAFHNGGALDYTYISASLNGEVTVYPQSSGTFV